MFKDYEAKIPKSDLVHGAYYYGSCRNASIARWNADKQRFFYWRTKFNSSFVEEICHPEDDKVFDVFVVEKEIDPPIKKIPFDNEGD
jgi:hypothetical protein